MLTGPTVSARGGRALRVIWKCERTMADAPPGVPFEDFAAPVAAQQSAVADRAAVAVGKVESFMRGAIPTLAGDGRPCLGHAWVTHVSHFCIPYKGGRAGHQVVSRGPRVTFNSAAVEDSSAEIRGHRRQTKAHKGLVQCGRSEFMPDDFDTIAVAISTHRATTDPQLQADGTTEPCGPGNGQFDRSSRTNKMS